MRPPFHDDREKSELADRAFHVLIARATGNDALVGVVEHLWDQRGRLWSRMELHFHTAELRSATLNDHRAILEAIVARDPSTAGRAMRRHLERVARQFARNWGAEDPMVPTEKTSENEVGSVGPSKLRRAFHSANSLLSNGERLVRGTASWHDLLARQMQQGA
ncbi:FadR/GntR family transcriptional regulator [Variovorax sp. GT1P44]|uniref:FadR/GntR family transcriptional regulator n=1 Tax=Variovorax sp. GT1P44 TaxID=3443742 RepID=UPI003F44CFB9